MPTVSIEAAGEQIELEYGSGQELARRGTWVLFQVASVQELNSQRSRIEAALDLPGVVGFSVRFPWDAADITGSATSHPILTAAKAIAVGKGKALSVRFMAGAHTPARVFDAGAAYYLVSGQRVPLPWSGSTGDHNVFLREYRAYAGKLADWCRANGVTLLHFSWWGQDWAELNHGKEVRGDQGLPATGYTYAKWLSGQKAIIQIAADLSGPDLAVELPLSGYGPLSDGQSAALADEVIRLMGPDSDRFYIQANGWGPNGEWGVSGANAAQTEASFDQIWGKPVRRGLQMIQPDGYNWPVVFARLYETDATYAEVYLPSFWQIPGPTAQYNHNTAERIAQLQQEIAAFADPS